MPRARIAVTGLGLVTPLGTDADLSWNAVLAGARSARWMTGTELGVPDQPGPATGQVWFGCPVDAFDAADCPEDSLMSSLPASLPEGFSGRLVPFARRAAREAIRQAGLNPDELRTAGCVIGTSKPDLVPIDHWLEALTVPSSEHLPETTHHEAASPGSNPWPGMPSNAGPSVMECQSATLVPQAWFPSHAASVVAAELGCMGAVLCPVAACATGLASIIRGADLIREGVCPVVIAGSADASLHPGLLASYRRLGVLADPGDDPAGACRPADARRNGFAVGEGAACLVLEDWDHARGRGARPLAEWLDGCIAGDPSGLTSVDESGATLASLIDRLVDRQKLLPRRIQVVNLHGTGTRQNDLAEAQALRRCFGPSLERVACFALKGGLGHLMGAAGAVETALSVRAIAAQTVPPTANHLTFDPACGIHLNRTVRPVACEHLLKLSLGFGGQIAAGLLKRC